MLLTIFLITSKWCSIIRALTKISKCGVYMHTISTAQATGIAALHACFLPVNPPYCTQITKEIQAQNRRVKKIHTKFWKLSIKFYTQTVCNWRLSSLAEICEAPNDDLSPSSHVFRGEIRMIISLTSPATKLLLIQFHFVDAYFCSLII